MPRISYFPVEDLVDPELQAALRHAARHGVPSPESQAIRAHAPEVLRAFTRAWDRTYRHGVCDREIKEQCRRAVCEGVADPADERERAAIEYARAIADDPSAADDELWTRLHRYFSDDELVELGWFVGLVLGQHRWLSSVQVGHGEVLTLNRAGVVV